LTKGTQIANRGADVLVLSRVVP